MAPNQASDITVRTDGRGGPNAAPTPGRPSDTGHKPAPSRQVEVGSSFRPAQLQFASGTSDRFTYSQFFCPVDLSADDPKSAQTAGGPSSPQSAGGQFSSNIGLLFLDRTRIVPDKAILGEELISLSLAPGETVVFSQQSSSERTTSFEQQDETDQQISQQYGSTLTTALEQGLSNQQQNSDRSQSGISGTIGVNRVVNVSVSPSFSNSVSSADTATQQQSLKQTISATQQVTSTYRAQHKTTFTVTSKQTFQATNQRTITNPNKFTPIDLRYFKIYQEIRLSLERYGVRLAWAPVVQDPAQPVLTLAKAASAAVISDAVKAANLPGAPVPPTPPIDAPAVPAGTSTTFSPGVNLGQGVSANNAVTILNPNAKVYQWDQKALTLSAVLGSAPQIPPSSVTQVLSAFADSAGNIQAEIHAGYGTSVGSPSDLVVTVTANFVSIPTAADISYQQALADYQQKLSAYHAQVASLQAAAAAAAQPTARAAYEAVLAGADPLNTCISQVISGDIPSSDYSSPAEIDVWRSIFDWSAATVQLYPAWWSTSPVNDPGFPATSFVNASWARLYLPVRPGMEALALAAAADVGGQQPDSAKLKGFLQDLASYRTKNFGDPGETPTRPVPGSTCPEVAHKFLCLATWSELLPTDGTHLEVLQAATAADDDISDQMLAIQDELLTAETTALGDLAAKAANVHVGVRLREGLWSPGPGKNAGA